jgi:predicted glycoside hydrolase/deacetylase ChbG (UPF0249 family)
MDIFGDRRIRLIFRLDDIGFSHASNRGLQQILDRGGCASAVSVLVNGEWVDETIGILARHPRLSAGVHLCLNCEWRTSRWGPVSRPETVRSLVDEQGKFLGTRAELVARNPDPDEVETELRAQIELAIAKGLKPSYLDLHMSAAASTPAMKERLVRVARSFGLPVSRWNGELPGPGIYHHGPAAKLAVLLEGLRRLREPGVYVIVCHVADDTPELRALEDVNPATPQPMWEHRVAEMEMLCDPALREAIVEQGIEIVGYEEVRKMLPRTVT